MIITLQHGDDPLRSAAAYFHRHPGAARKHTRILLPTTDAAASLRQRLLQHPAAGNAVLLPEISSLKTCLDNLNPPAHRILNTHGQELMLVEVLQDLGYSWQMADELLRWFEALQLSNQPPEKFDELLNQTGLDGFSEDAAKLRLLWNAWQTQLQSEGATTQTMTYAQGLQTVSLPDNEFLMLLGHDWLHQNELQFILRCLQNQQAAVFLYPEYPLSRQLQLHGLEIPPPASAISPTTLFYDTTYQSGNGSLFQRAATLQSGHTEPPACTTFTASSSEQEARAIDLQTRLWLTEGLQSIAIVTEDRRLARRCSALLHRAGIAVQDNAGWPLSTTAAAGILERWLETIETDFNHLPLLDVLKSRFLRNTAISDQAVFHLQLDIIEHEGIPQSIGQYLKAIERRTRALPGLATTTASELRKLLDAVSRAAAPLLELLDTAQQPPARYLESLVDSLSILGLWQGYETDAAGQRIQQEILDMQQALENRTLRFDWKDFRNWLARALETHNFRPERGDSPVQILNYDQSRLGCFDAVILAGSTSRHLPGAPSRHVFFNDAVRHEFKLKTWEIARQQRFGQYRRLLQAAPRILLSYTAEADGAPIQPAPWLAMLQTFHDTVYPTPCEDTTLRQYLQAADTQVETPFPAASIRATRQPAPTIPPDLLPPRLSANAHQQIIRCPYQFFAARGLRLQAREEIAEKLDKREYGSLVHRCLQAFHTDIKALPGPFTLPLTNDHREPAIALLEEISMAVFEPDQHQDFESLGLWRTWKALLSEVIDWEIEHARNWQTWRTESDAAMHIGTTGIELFGKIDRIDLHGKQRALIDYKTGRAPEKKAILSGEDVQLVSYALLVESVVTATYLRLGKNVDDALSLDEETLSDLMPQMEKRLETVILSLQQGARLPAWGHEEFACKYCAMTGLCRSGYWSDTGAS